MRVRAPRDKAQQHVNGDHSSACRPASLETLVLLRQSCRVGGPGLPLPVRRAGVARRFAQMTAEGMRLRGTGRQHIASDFSFLSDVLSPRAGFFAIPPALRCGHPGAFTQGTDGGRCVPTCVCQCATCSPSPLMVATGQRPLSGRDAESMARGAGGGISFGRGVMGEGEFLSVAGRGRRVMKTSRSKSSSDARRKH